MRRGNRLTARQIESPRAGALRSRPVSRILSRVTIHLLRLPGSSAGCVDGACSPCTGRGLASRRVATTLVSSYLTVSPLPSASPEIRRRRSVFCATVRRLSPPPSRERPALWCPDFPRRPKAPRSPGLRAELYRDYVGLDLPVQGQPAFRAADGRAVVQDELPAHRALERS